MASPKGSARSEVPIEIFEGAQGNVILKGLREQKITCAKDLALIYDAAVF